MTKMIGVDVGGTFTDVFVLDEASGVAEVAKVPTSRPDQSGGFLDGISHKVDDLASVGVVVHGTTAGTNALLERKGAKIGIITTEGLRDVLEMRRRDRPRTWGLRGDFEPVVPRNLRLEVPERTLADGTVRVSVDLDAVRAAARELIDQGCLAVAILFANAYANPENERNAVEAVRAIWPNPHFSASSEILPEIREFERFSTTALNALPSARGFRLHRTSGQRAQTRRLWRRVHDRAIKWRGHGHRYGLPPASAHGLVRSGRRRDRSGPYRSHGPGLRT